MKTLLLVTALFLTAQVSEGAVRNNRSYEGYTGIAELDYPADDHSIFDEVRLHVGAAFLTSLQNFDSYPGNRESAGLRGFDLNFGADLFSANWMAEGHLINFPETSVGSSKLAANGFELRVVYDSAIYEAVTLHLGVGIASRSYTIKTQGRRDSTFSSAASVIAVGSDYWLSGQFSAGAEVTAHTPLVSGDDPSSLDLGLKVSGHF